MGYARAMVSPLLVRQGAAQGSSTSSSSPPPPPPLASRHGGGLTRADSGRCCAASAASRGVRGGALAAPGGGAGGGGGGGGLLPASEERERTVRVQGEPNSWRCCCCARSDAEEPCTRCGAQAQRRRRRRSGAPRPFACARGRAIGDGAPSRSHHGAESHSFATPPLRAVLMVNAERLTQVSRHRDANWTRTSADARRRCRSPPARLPALHAPPLGQRAGTTRGCLFKKEPSRLVQLTQRSGRNPATLRESLC